MNTIFEANSLERNYQFLDELPESLYPVVVTHTQGKLPQRVQGIMAWRKALLDGHLPNEQHIDWPNQPVLGKILNVLDQLDITRFCQQQAELTDNLLLEVCEAVSQFEKIQGEQFNKHFEELKQLEEQRKSEQIQQNKLRKQSARKSKKVVKDFKQIKALSIDEPSKEQNFDTQSLSLELDAETLEQLNKEASRLAGENAADVTSEQFLQDWQERARVWHELAEVFDELAGLLGRGWDLSQGLLASQGCLEMVRLRKLLEQIPQLKELVRTLGKMQISTEEDTMPVMEQLFEPVKRLFEELKEIQSPLAPMETRGITRSDDISRMLPSELVFLGHPKLKMLWHARRAEKALLTYRVEGVLSEHVLTENEILESKQQPGKKERLERGPIIICLDTSGSMHGSPEMVAKALTLEAMRTAHKEKRACYLYAFSGPQEVIEHQLELTAQGLTEFMAFLIQSFHGGTDIQAPLEKAVAKLDTEEWKRADIMVVTDGEFSVPSNTVELINKAKEKNKLRVHGVLVGGWNSIAMDKLCNPVHRFSDWQAF
ncbi:VWA domain-containing protein [Candidatus Parabeggiatoa sp. HSG14]|uniref:VWA domain-containing protein n=1 Tax=Candidatus Parabeggiatoa sp. HSG14 TaxID=3055593 RepID=UPI0025A7F902|nr:VWA domain-containing protein [Thiotrichales bacterium HSG14]